MASRLIHHVDDMAVFACIVERGSLSAAARQLDLSLAVVSKRLLRLETALGLRLLNRSTRQLSLTEDGRAFHADCQALLAQLQRAEEALASRRDEVSGMLRITASHAFARRHIAPRLGRFLDRWPAVRIELLASDDLLDLVKNGLDLAVRQADLPESGLVARTIAQDRRVLCAAPAYVERHGQPATPAELARHRCIVFGNPAFKSWTLMHADAPSTTVEIDAAVHVHAGDAAHGAALGGAGVVFKSIWEVADDLAAGRLVEVLPGWRSVARPIHAVYPSARQQMPRLRCFIDFLVDELTAAAPARISLSG